MIKRSAVGDTMNGHYLVKTPPLCHELGQGAALTKDLWLAFQTADVSGANINGAEVG